MKTKIYFISCAVMCFVLLAGIMAFRSDNPKGDTIIIRATQDMSEKDSRICVFKGNLQIEKSPLGKWQDNEEDKNYDKIISAVRKYCDTGYEVTSAFETADGSKTLYSTFVLTKK